MKTRIEYNGKDISKLSKKELIDTLEIVLNNKSTLTKEVSRNTSISVENTTKENPKLFKDKEYIFYRESFVQSFLSDLTSFTFLIGGFGVNQLFIQSKMLSAILLVMFLLFMIGKSNTKSKTFNNLSDLKQYVSKLKEQNNESKSWFFSTTRLINC